jgi:aspartate ammonia-lyase
METKFRTERDQLGEAAIPVGALHGIQTARALANFGLAGRPVHPELVSAYGAVKAACLRAGREAGAWAGRES